MPEPNGSDSKSLPENEGKASRPRWRDILSALRRMGPLSSPASISRRVTESFQGGNPEIQAKYLDWLYGSISNAIQSVRRTVVSIVALMAAFELVVNSSAKASITIFSFTISKHSIVIQFIPAIVAFLMVQMAHESIDADRSKAAFTRAFQLWLANAPAHGTSEYIWPSSQVYWTPFNNDLRQPVDPIDRIRGRINRVFTGMFLVTQIAFLVQAYYKLFTLRLNGDFPLWVTSVVFTFFCLASGAILAVNESGVFSLWLVRREQKKSPPRSPSSIAVDAPLERPADKIVMTGSLDGGIIPAAEHATQEPQEGNATSTPGYG